MFNEFDTRMMQTALKLAENGRYSTSPNPRVGCVITRGEQIIGQGFHLKAGGPHAEVHALQQAGEWANGATAYVTLEPCSHHGRTPPCAQSLIHAGISRVVAAMSDPNPLVAGKGLAMLADAGISVQSGLLESKARRLNRGFLSRIERGRPFVTLKCAASMDGKTALSNGQSQWITGSEARADVQKLRASSCAIITGIGTILADNPQLNVRTFPTLRQPLRVILDSRLRTPLNSQVVQDSRSPTLIATLETDPARHTAYLKHKHISILCLSEKNHHIDLNELLFKLAQQGIGEIMIEAGSTLNSSFMQQKLIDEIVLYQSPKILGHQAHSLFNQAEDAEILKQAPHWHPVASEIIGNDLKTIFEPLNNA